MTNSLDYLDRLEQLVLERAKRKESIAADQERIGEIDAILQTQIAEGETRDLAGHKVTHQPGSQLLDKTALEKDFPAQKMPIIYSTSLDTKLVKKHFSPSILAQYQKPTQSSIRVK